MPFHQCLRQCIPDLVPFLELTDVGALDASCRVDAVLWQSVLRRITLGVGHSFVASQELRAAHAGVTDYHVTDYRATDHRVLVAALVRAVIIWKRHGKYLERDYITAHAHRQARRLAMATSRCLRSPGAPGAPGALNKTAAELRLVVACGLWLYCRHRTPVFPVRARAIQGLAQALATEDPGMAKALRRLRRLQTSSHVCDLASTSNTATSNAEGVLQPHMQQPSQPPSPTPSPPPSPPPSPRLSRLAALAVDGQLIRLLPREALEDEAMFQAAVRTNRFAVDLAPTRLRNSPDFWLKICGTVGSCVEFAPLALRRNRTLALVAVRQDGRALEHLPCDMRMDRAIVEAAVSRHGLALRFVPESLRVDRGLVDIAVAQDGRALRYAEEFCGDYELVLRAVRSRGVALEHAAPHLQDDLRIAWAAVEADGQAVAFASTRLLAADDARLARFALQRDPSTLRLVEAFLRQEDIVAHVAQHGDAVYGTSHALRDNRPVALAAVRSSPLALGALGALRFDKTVVRAAVFADPQALQHTPWHEAPHLIVAALLSECRSEHARRST
jgi:hypothetical protein